MTCPHPDRERDICTCSDPVDSSPAIPARTVRLTDLAACQMIAMTPEVTR